MTDESTELRRINWSETFPFTRIFQSFKMAVHLSKLLLALGAILLILGGAIAACRRFELAAPGEQGARITGPVDHRRRVEVVGLLGPDGARLPEPGGEKNPPVLTEGVERPARATDGPTAATPGGAGAARRRALLRPHRRRSLRRSI